MPSTGYILVLDEIAISTRSSSRIGIAIPPTQYRANGNKHDPEQNTRHSAGAVLGGHACEVAWHERGQRACGDQEVYGACDDGHDPYDEDYQSECPPSSHPKRVADRWSLVRIAFPKLGCGSLRPRCSPMLRSTMMAESLIVQSIHARSARRSRASRTSARKPGSLPPDSTPEHGFVLAPQEPPSASGR